MTITPAHISSLLILQPRLHGDSRGFFMETFRHETLAGAGIPALVQDNHSRSVKNTLRGLHYQHPYGQGKLVRVIRGCVWDVAVDIRRSSPTFGQWHGMELSEENHTQLWIPPGFAHGFCVLSDTADFLYKCSEYYHPETEHTILWNDPDLGIDWKTGDPLLSEKDQRGMRLKDVSDLPE